MTPYFTIEPKVEGRQMTKGQWKHAHREARILTKTIKSEAALSSERITKWLMDVMRFGYGITKYRHQVAPQK